MNIRRNIPKLLTTFAAAYAMKYFYSNSSVNDLRWILAPTTYFVELFTGMQFRFEANAGYLSDDRSFLIAQPCSGMNFMIIAFVMLAVGKLWRDRNLNWLYLPIALVMSYFATVVANTVRIVLALELRKYDLGYDYEDVHLVEGIVVYFGFLLLLFVVSERLGSHRVGYRQNKPISLRRVVSPLMIYYAVTLGIPVARGVFNEPEFLKHAAVVLIIPLVLLVPFALISLMRGSDESEKNVNAWS